MDASSARAVGRRAHVMLFWLITRYVSCWALTRPVGKGPCNGQMGKPSGGKKLCLTDSHQQLLDSTASFLL